MRSEKVTLIVAISLLALAMPGQILAQHRYKLIDLGTLGGPNSSMQDPPIRALNNRGMVVGTSETSMTDPTFPNSCIFCGDPLIVHTFAWQDGALSDLGALPGTNTSGVNWISDTGLSVGFSSNNNMIDPLLGIPEMHATLWKNGEITDLGTLEGGHESAAQAVNNKGQVVGVSTNLVPDPFGPLGTQNHMFLWQNGTMQDLGTLGGPDTGFLGLIGNAVINERGQVASCSYTNATANPVTGTPTLDPFLWERGVMRDLGSLGGTSGCAISLNNRGQVVGYSNLAGDSVFHPFLWDHAVLKDLGTLGGDNAVPFQINDRGSVVGRADVTDICTACAPGNQKQLHHPFLWTNGVMLDLGLVSGDTGGTAYSVNSKNQVVGVTRQCTVISPDDSCDGPTIHAFLWEAGSIFDLQTLLVSDSGIRVFDVRNINERGEIAGIGALPNGDTHAVLLIPCGDDDSECGESAGGATAAVRDSRGAVKVNAGNAALRGGPSAMLHGFGRGFQARSGDVIGCGRASETQSSSSTPVLTGYCVAPSYPRCAVKLDLTHCPAGQPARGVLSNECGKYSAWSVCNSGLGPDDGKCLVR